MIFKKRIIDYKSFLISLFIIVLPFVYSDSTLDPVLTLRFLSFSILVLALCLLSIKEKIDKSLLGHPIFLAFTSLLIIYGISTFFISHVISEGIYSILKLAVFIVFSIIVANVLKDDSCRDRIFNSVSIFSLICCVLYLYEFIGFTSNNNDFRNIESLASTMSNKNLLSSALFLTIPFNFYNLKSKNKVFKFLSILALLLILTVCYLTMSKATLLALIILSISIFIIKFSPQYFSRLYYFSIVFIFIISCFTLLYIGKSKSSFTDKIKQNLIEYSGNDKLFSNKKASFGTRLNLYNNTLNLIQKNPLLGIGPGNWKIQHGQYSLYRTLGEDGRKLVQRPHSDFLWIASEGGIIAGIIYLMIFLIALKTIHKKSFEDKEGNVLFNYSIFGTLLGYFVISLFDFPFERVTHNLFFFLLLSYLISVKSNENLNFLKRKYNQLFWYFSILIICSSTVVANARHSGEIYLTKAKFYKGKNSWQAIIKNVDKAFIPNIYEIDRSGTPIHWYRGVANFSIGKLEDSFEDFKLAYNYNPYHLHVLNNIGTIYEIKGKSTIAKKYYRKALLISPRFEEVSVNLSAILYNEQKIQESLNVILRCNIQKDHLKYDKYLKIISLKLIDNYLNEKQLSNSDRNKILVLKRLFRDDYKLARSIMRELYEGKKTFKGHYLDLYLSQG